MKQQKLFLVLIKFENNWKKEGKGEKRLLSANCESSCLGLGQGTGSNKET